MNANARILASLLFAASAHAGSAEKAPLAALEAARAQAGAERQVKNRVVLFSDDNRASVPELHLAQGIPTTLVFPVNIDEGATRLADSQHLIYKPQFFKNTAVLSPRVDLLAGVLIPLTIALEDGTLLSFVLRTVPSEADFQVTVEVKFERDLSPESVAGLKQTIAQMQS